MRLFAEMADKGQAGLSYAFSAALELVHQGEVLFEIDGGLAETLWRLVHRAIGGRSEGVAKVIDVDIDGELLLLFDELDGQGELGDLGPIRRSFCL